jgi:hypothetical protein
MSNLLLNNLASAISGMQALQRVETPAACLTLTRSATLSITTAGTLITWQTETRNNGFTWSTDTITMPTAGFYAVQTFLQTSSNVTMFTQRQINSVNIGYFGNSTTAINYHVATMVRYFAAADALQIRVLPSANTTLNVSADGTANESPILHIVQLTGSQT